jgi:YegS/Rv2252/BmrU family lipid kinase
MATDSETTENNLLIVLNPIAGKGKALGEYPKIEQFLKAHKQNYEIVLTKGPRDAEDIVRKYPLTQNTAVIAAGGDGTCNEVINGLLTRSEKPQVPHLFGILPIGRGNDFSYTAKIPEDLEKALDILIQRKTNPLDVGVVAGGYFPDGRYFVNGVGIGFDTKVGFEAAKMKRVKSGLAYAFGAIKMLIQFPPSPVLEISYDEKKMTLNAIIVSVTNGKRMGGTFFMCPNALLDDGLLDLCITKHSTRIKIAGLIAHYTKGTQEGQEGVFTGRAVEIKLRALEGGMAAHCDGETVCIDGKELAIRCIPGVLRLITA